MKKLRVLVIDDKKENLKAAQMQLSDKFELTLASSFDEAEAILNHNNDHWYKDGQAKFDVVLTDMMLPASLKGVAGGNYPEQPYGLIFLLNAMRRGIKMIGLVTHGSHHSSPIHWALDMIGYEESKKVFRLGDVKFWCHWICMKEPDEKVKDWELVINDLLQEN